MTRRPRDLRAEERRLWQEVARFVRPLAGRAPLPDLSSDPPPPAPGPDAKPPPRGVAGKRRLAAEGGRARPPEPSPALPVGPVAAPPVRSAPLVPLDRKVLRALARGRLAVEASVDLHGLTQADAHAALIGFLLRAQAQGFRLVQVVTGKGRTAGPDGFGERGILRRAVPHWLRGAPLRTVVLGFDEAAPHHGGAGALYVRLRRRPVA